MLLVTRTCRECKKEKNVDGHTFDGVCGECKRAQAAEEKQKYLYKLSLLSLEERIGRIESQLYDLGNSVKRADRFIDRWKPLR